MALSDQITFVKLGSLRPDSSNPRLRHDKRGVIQDDELLVFIEGNFNAIVIAESIARHGFFGSEPLVVCKIDDELVVLEGNRRLTALLGLARPELRKGFSAPLAWEKLAENASIDLAMEVPVLVAATREDADALIGFRHISGIDDWKPLQRAQFVAYLVDERGKSFLEVAETVGEDEPTVRQFYRNQSILERARSLGRDDIADKNENRFGTFTAALNRNGIREFLHVRTVRDVREKQSQLADNRIDELSELTSWLFGSEDGQKVIAETRDLSALAEVIRFPAALTELRASRRLAAAYALTPGPPKRILKQFAIANGNLRSVVNSLELILDEERTEDLVAELEKITAEILDLIAANQAK